MTPRVVVVGAGHLGRYHLQKVAALPRARLAGVVDVDAGARARAAEQHGVRGAAHLSAFAGEAEAAIVAAPTHAHEILACQALALGMHVLVEKPLAATLPAAERIVAAARAANRFCQVGHVERFNPAIAAALRMVDRPRYIVAERLTPFSGRGTDVDVVLDLMIHDLDIVASLIAAPLREVRAIGVPVFTNATDMAAARLTFADGAVAQLSAGRASLDPSRKIRLFTLERYVSIDCQRREVKAVRRLASAAGGWPEIAGEPVAVPEGDALADQLASFIEAIVACHPPKVDGAAGVRAMQLAGAVKDALVVPLGDGGQVGVGSEDALRGVTAASSA